MQARIKTDKALLRAILAIVLCVFLTVGAGLFPLIYFHLSDEAQIHGVHSRKTPSANIDPQAEDIYLLGAIRDLYESASSAPDIWSASQSFPQAYKELLEEAGFPPGYGALLPAQPVFYSNAGGENRMLSHYVAVASEATAQDPLIRFQIEQKTGKLIFLGIGQKGLATSLPLPDRQKLMDGYLQYLGLDVLNDWKENEIGRMSAKAQMQLYCLYNDDGLLLCVAPIGFYDNNRLPDLLSSLLTWSQLVPAGPT
ncbi:hypothetical protein [Zongyangia hominis]|uniref:Uncharacterized protein n=1 Tax=Zongyangia hominis TaxID=2763677 RepID=A0A926IBP1_9FIRM|nr:hypothetical protein [Zongyangia hominis]MBC8570483.1 hypothetical protein [Zongyangia hominis]